MVGVWKNALSLLPSDPENVLTL